MATSPIRLGIIGTGLAVEKLHWPALEQLTEQFTVTAFSNRGRENAEHFCSYSGASMDNYVQDYHELLARDDVDAVLISLPIAMNATVMRESLEAGKHVICEKPPAANEEEARGLIEIERAHPDQVLLIAENVFYRDDVRYAKSLIEQGAIGRPHLMSWRHISRLVPQEGEFSSTPWRHRADYVGGPHLDGGVHQIAQLRMLLGDVRRFSAETQDANSTHSGPSDLTLNLRFVGGAIGSYASSNPELAMPPEPNELRIYGSEAVMSVAYGKVTVFREGETETYSFEDMDGGYYGEFLNFHEAIRGQAPVVGTLVQSIRNMELVTKGLESAQSGTVIELADDISPLSETPLGLWRPAGSEVLGIEVAREVSANA